MTISILTRILQDKKARKLTKKRVRMGGKQIAGEHDAKYAFIARHAPALEAQVGRAQRYHPGAEEGRWPLNLCCRGRGAVVSSCLSTQGGRWVYIMPLCIHCNTMRLHGALCILSPLQVDNHERDIGTLA